MYQNQLHGPFWDLTCLARASPRSSGRTWPWERPQAVSEESKYQYGIHIETLDKGHRNPLYIRPRYVPDSYMDPLGFLAKVLRAAA